MGFNQSITCQVIFYRSDNQVESFLVNWYSSGINLETNAIVQLWPDCTFSLKIFLNRKLSPDLHMYQL